MINYLLSLTLLAATLSAAPAFEKSRILIQNDGATFQAQMKGDEYLHWIETTGGSILIYNKKSKNYEHANIKNNALVPSGQAFRSASKQRIQQSASFQKEISQEALSELWIKKRQEGLNH
ncbi:MAG: hypothetical protein DRG24_01135 [Epsilonproteobacteria bacterium]|nr:MAG: hypothetical protein DRG24_01135 [Campylobacterota bacterium]